MAAIDLCTLDDVRQHAQYQSTQTADDPVIGGLITRMSRSIIRHYAREFAPATTSATRTLEFNPCRSKIPVDPWDLRAITALVVDQGTTDEQTLTTSQWRLTWRDPTNGTYRGIELYPGVLKSSRWSTRTLAITGSWGFATVPEDVTEACVLAVIAHLRGEVQAFGGSLQPNSFGDNVNDPVAFPPGVRGLLEPFRVYGIG